MQVRSLGWEDPLEEGMATHSSILAWRTHGQRSPMGYSPWGHKELDTTKQLNNNNLMMLSNHSVGEDSLESLGLQGDPTSPS